MRQEHSERATIRSPTQVGKRTAQESKSKQKGARTVRTALIRRPAWRSLNRADGFDRLFDGMFGGWNELLQPTETDRTWAPAVDVRETSEAVVVTADLPGVDPEQIKLHIEENVLTVEGERTDEKETTEGEVHRTERFHGTFRRTIRLSQHVDTDGIKAEYRHGVLSITCPLKEEAKPREIQVSAN